MIVYMTERTLTRYIADLRLDLMHGAPQLREDQRAGGVARTAVSPEVVAQDLFELVQLGLALF